LTFIQKMSSVIKTFGAAICLSSSTTRAGLLAEARFVELPYGAEAALERAAARRLHEGQWLAEIDVVVRCVTGDEVARRKRQLVELAARRGMAGGDLRAATIQHQAGNTREITASFECSDQREHDLLTVADGDGVECRIVERFGIARSVVPAEDDEGAGKVATHPLREPQRAAPFGGEVALQADDVRSEAPAIGEAALLAVDAQVMDGAGVSCLL
jgi:hypothetical protein